MADTFNTTESDWQGVDDEPVDGSGNLVKSGGVYDRISTKLGAVKKYNITNTVAKYINAVYNTIFDSDSYVTSYPILLNVGDKVKIRTYGSGYSTGLIAKCKSDVLEDPQYCCLVGDGSTGAQEYEYTIIEAGFYIVSWDITHYDTYGKIETIEHDLTSIVNSSILPSDADTISLKKYMINSGYIHVDGVSLDDQYWGYTNPLFLHKGDKLTIYAPLMTSTNHALVAKYPEGRFRSNISPEIIVRVNGGSGFQTIEHTFQESGYYVISMAKYYYDSYATLVRTKFTEVDVEKENISKIESLPFFSKSRLKPNAHNTLPSIAFNIDILGSSNAVSICETILPIFEEYGLTAGIALKANNIAIASFVSKYKNWQKRGFDIINHGLDSEVYDGSMSLETAKTNIFLAHKNLVSNGLVVNSWCSPKSTFNSDFYL